MRWTSPPVRNCKAARRRLQASFPGTGYGSTNGMQVFDPGQYAERVGLLLMNGQIYLAWTSHCDEDPYTGLAHGLQ